MQLCWKIYVLLSMIYRCINYQDDLRRTNETENRKYTQFLSVFREITIIIIITGSIITCNYKNCN